MTIAFRPAAPPDLPFIIGTWETSYRLAHTSGMISMKNWAAVMRAEIADYLARPYVRTFVAYETTDRDPGLADLYGFIAAEPDESPPLVYFVYTKDNFRREGVARGLFAAAGIDPMRPFEFVCSTPIVPKLARKIPFAKWAPLRGRYSREARRPSR